MKTLRYILFVLIPAAYFILVPRVAMKYAENWNTFYWDKHMVGEQIARNGVGNVVRSWLLQFYAEEWIGTAVMVVMTAGLMCLLYFAVSRWMKEGLAWCTALVLGVISMVGISCWVSGTNIGYCCGLQIGAENERFMSMNNYIRESNWDAVLDVCEKERPLNNMLFQNCKNMALAEKGMLGECLLDEPCSDIRSIYVNDIATPYVAAFLSDIYYSMGHMAQAQRYAFETNEKMNNLSPRLLQRLVLTNIIYGQYAVAEKYLKILRKAVFYREWCEHYSTLLYNDEAVEKDVELGVKRKCLFADNRFSGLRGLDDDLLHVARNTRGTRQCMTTLQYLGSLYILAGYEKQYKSMCKEFADVLVKDGKMQRCFERFRSMESEEESEMKEDASDEEAPFIF